VGAAGHIDDAAAIAKGGQQEARQQVWAEVVGAQVAVCAVW
jgi:hypothetical protein